MAQEWYLIKSDHDYVSGFESDGFEEMAQDAFEETLNSVLGTGVEICNYDLTECTPVRVIIQGNVQDTKLNSMQRRILARIGTIKAGQYIKYSNKYWLVVGFVDNNKVYEKAIIVLCNYLLTWMDNNGKVIQRWVNASSASQYNNGETSTPNFFVRSDQLMILTPDDEECLMLNHKQRFIIDKRCKIYEKNFDNDVVIDTSNKVLTYELTRIDNVLYDYQDSGHSEFMAYQDEQHENDGYIKIGDNGYWLCDIQQKTIENNINETSILSSRIECDSDTPEIICGIEPRIFTAVFYDDSGNVVEDITPIWNIVCSFADKLEVEYVGNSIMISANDNNTINKSFELLLSGDNYTASQVKVTIVPFI